MDRIWDILGPVFLAFERAGELAVSQELLPYTGGALFVALLLVMRWRRQSMNARHG